jgi:hypothetical protein
MRSFLLLSLAAVLGWYTPPASMSAPRDVVVASVDTVDLTPALDTLFGKQPFSLTARTVDSVGRTKNTRVSWIVRDSSLFRTLKTGGTYSTTFRAFAVGDTGRTYVVASAGSKKDSSLIIVRDTVCTPGVFYSLDVRPDSAIQRYKDTTTVVGLPRDNCGALLPGGINITWASTSTGDATVSSLDSLLGRVLMVDSTGTVYIRGTSGTIKDSAKIILRGNPGS